MIKLLISIPMVLFPLFVYSQETEDNCETSILSPDIEAIATSFQVTNCNNKKQFKSANRNLQQFCHQCISSFRDGANKNKDLKIEIPKIDLKRAAVNELKRSLSSNLLDIVKLRSIYSTNTDFTAANRACDIIALENRLSQAGCTNGISLKDLRTELGEELGNLLSKKPNYNDKGILKRSQSKSCDISDGDIIRAQALSVENALTPDIVEAISNMKATDDMSFTDALIALGSKYPFSTAFGLHPLFSQLQSPPAKLISFFKNIPRPITKDQIRSSLYTGQGTTSNIASDIAKRCQDSFSAFEAMVCNEDVQKGKVKANSLKDTIKFLIIPDLPGGEYVDFSSTQDTDINLTLSAVCELNSENKNAFDLKDGLDNISRGMPGKYTSMPYEEYKQFKYDNEIGLIRASLCQYQNGGAICEDGNYNCELYRLIQKQNDIKTVEGRLAASSDKAINSLLRTMIGNSENLSTETKATLIKEGILPKNVQGEFVAQPDVPERRPDYVAKMAEASRPSPVTPPAAASAPATPTKASPIARPTAQSATPATALSAPYIPPALPTGTPSTDQILPRDDEMAAIDDEILRRLSSDATDPKKPVTKEDARKAVREVYKEKNIPLAQGQEYAIADRAMQSYRPNYSSAGTLSSDEKSTITPGETAKEQWEKEQKLKALSGMYGAQQTAAEAAAAGATATGGGRAPASATEGKTEEKKLSTVALHLGEEKAGRNLSEVLDAKFLKNDSEAQLLKSYIHNKKDFILQLNNVSFKVKFDRTRGRFDIAFDRGDTLEAERLRPQLEKFFNRVNAYAAN